MFKSFGGPEILILLAILLLLFGASRVPALARGLGQSVHEFRKGFRSGGDEDETTVIQKTDRRNGVRPGGH